MFTKPNFLKVLSMFAILVVILSSTQPPVAQAQSSGNGDGRQVKAKGGDGVTRKVNARSGKVSFIRPEKGSALSAAEALKTSIRPQDPAMALAKRFAPEFGIKNPEQELAINKSHRGLDGRVTTRYQQKYQGIPVLGGELIVNTDDNGDLYSMNGEVSPDLSLSTQATIDSATAKAMALQEVAKSYQKNAEEFVATEPQLWIYDESLLKESSRPIELDWRMDVTAKDTGMPVRELVLVNAQSGDVSLHFNQIDTQWKTDKTPPSTPQPTAPPAATQGAPSSAAVTTGQLTTLATTWYVATTGNNSNSCTAAGSPCLTINGAISKAALTGDTIKVAVGTYTGSGTEVILINKSVTLSGGWNASFTAQSGMSTIDGQNARLGMTLVDGSVTADRFIFQNGYSFSFGGGIYNGGTLVLNTSIIRNNNCCEDLSGASGGAGISNWGTLTVNNSVIADNISVREGGGIYNNPSSTLTVNNSTISGNEASVGAGISSYRTVTINNSTISGNSAIQNAGGLGYGGGIHFDTSQGGSFTILNSIVAGNSAASSGPDCQGFGSINSSGYNLIGSSTGCSYVAATGDLVGTNAHPINPLLTPLQDNGGPTFTHALITGSPAIDAGNAATCLSTDQRGVARPVGARCDMGAYEGSVAGPPYRVSTYTAGNTSALPGTFLCNQYDPNCASGDTDAKSAHKYAIGTYNFYATHFNRDSIDNNGMTITSTVHYCDPNSTCPYDNAFWSGTQMVYGDAHGYPFADDVVAHELTHGVTQHESDLLYYYQSGAINESLSDVFGEYYDQTNGQGNDTAGVKWQMGEDVTGLGALRSMSDPTIYGDPDKMSSPNYFTGGDDNGGVHFNSGVNNKAVYLMVDGGSFNGKTITGIGWDKVGAIYYEVNTNLLTSGADYSDLYYAVQQACSNLVGQHNITTANCVQVKNALDAVEMNFRQAFGNFDDPSFEDSYAVYPYWDQASTTFGSPLCTIADCGTSFGTAGPRTGSVWGWFGGTTASETASLSQIVYFPRGYPTIRLKFYLWIGRADNGSDANDKFVAQVDGVTVFTANATQKSSYPSYTPVIVDVSGFARNAPHVITFASVTNGQLVNFNLDDVSLGDALHTITGNAGVGNATLQYMDNGPRAVIADGGGNYSIGVPYNWTGTITPYKSGYIFTSTSRSYSNVQSNQISQNFTAQVCASCADVNAAISNAVSENFTIPPGGQVMPRFGMTAGPVLVKSTNSLPILTSQRAILGNSFNELTGFPANQLTNDYWFTYYDDVNMNTWLMIGNPDPVNSAHVEVYLGNSGTPIRTYDLAHGQSVLPKLGLVGGPLRVKSTNGVNIFTSQRAAYLGSFNELMGFPANQLSTDYWFTYYDDVNMNTWLMIGNPDPVNSAHVEVYLGNDTTPIRTYDLAHGQSVLPKLGTVGGPLRVKSTNGVKIFTSERSAYGHSFNELMGFPANQLATDYWFTYIDDVNMNTWLMIGNPDPVNSAHVEVYLGNSGTPLHTYDLAHGQSVLPKLGVVGGPLRVKSTNGVNIFTSERVAYGSSFNELMGFPANQLTTNYWFTYYDDVNMNTWLMIGKP